MPWASHAGAVLLPWYGGEEAADALADIIVGAAEPSGRLPISFPVRAEDGPAGGNAVRYPGVDGQVVYEEGVFVGYRFYETKGVKPLFAFGHGLSYGDIVFDDIAVSPDAVVVELVNRGKRPGTEVVQVYVRALEPRVERPDRELAGFAKVTVDAGGRATVKVPLDADTYRFWDVDTHGWRSDEGRYEILVGASSRDIRGIGHRDLGRCDGRVTGGDRRRGGRRVDGVQTVDMDMGPTPGRATTTPGDQGPSGRAVVRGRGRLRRRLHGPARRLHRHGGAADAPADVRRVGRRGDVGRPLVSLGARRAR